NRTGNGHDDVSAFVHQGLGEFITLLLIIEGHAEQTRVRSSRIPTEHLDIGALGFVVLGNTLVEAIHEDGHGGDRQAAKCTDNTGLGYAGSEVASQEGGFVSFKNLTSHVGAGGVIVVVH